MQFKLKYNLNGIHLRNILPFFLFFFAVTTSSSQDAKEYTNTIFLNKLNKDTSYLASKRQIVTEFAHTKPGAWGESVPGVINKLVTQNKYVAFTFDACGGKNGVGYDKELIDFLHNEKVPATLFISGKWIDANFISFLKLSRDTLFEIENHGLNHKPCSMDGKSIYGIQGTSNMGEAYDEIEANALKIEAITKTAPRFYRSATAYIDEACVRMAEKTGITVVGFQILSGDAVPFTPASIIEENVIKKIKPGAIVIMHFNHPEWNTFETMKNIVPKLRQMGYSFVRLKEFCGLNSLPNSPSFLLVK
jgi:peptidoglycan/xylan/chitin deacetylase (PgdA/CDA1 family)